MGRGNPIRGGIEGGILLTASDRKTTLRFLGLLKRYRGKIAFLMIALLISILLSLSSPMISRKLMDEGLVRGDFKVILKMILLLFAFRQISILLSLWKIGRAHV